MRGVRKITPQHKSSFDDDFAFAFRPETYWAETPTEASVLAQVEGTIRRELAQGALEGAELSPAGVEFVLEPRLDEQDRVDWGRLHPAMMGGEYLPDTYRDELEIARIELQSTTGDVYQVRARPEKEGIRYRLVESTKLR